MDKARQWLTRDWRRPPYHSTVGVMALGNDGDVGSSVHVGDVIPWKCCLRPPTQYKLHSRYYVSQISHRRKSHPIASHPITKPSIAGFGDAVFCLLVRLMLPR